MQEKTYSQMKLEYTNYYNNFIKEELPKHNKHRKRYNISNYTYLLAIRMLVYGLIFLIFAVPISVISINSHSENIFIYVCILLFVFLFVPFIFTISTIILCTAHKIISTNFHGELEIDFELNLKLRFMPGVVRIFLQEGQWEKTPRSVSNLDLWAKKIKDMKISKIFNPFWLAAYEDKISGKFKDTNINLYEIETSLLVTDLIIIVSMFTFFMYLLFSVNCLYIISIILLLLLPQLLRYSKFKGIMLEFDLNKNFKGHTIFYEKSFIAKKIPLDRKHYKKIKLESITFEKKYNVYSTDQIEARYILTPALIERIENLKFAFKAKYVRGSFKDNKLTLAIHTGKDMFAMGSDFKDSDIHTFEMLYDEMISVLKIVDELKLNEHTGL